MVWLAGWGGGVTFASGAISARSGRSRSPEAIVIGRKHLQALSGLGESCGSSGDGSGRAGGSRTADLGNGFHNRGDNSLANFQSSCRLLNGGGTLAETWHAGKASDVRADGGGLVLWLKVEGEAQR